MSNLVLFIADHPLILVMIADLIVGYWWINKFKKQLNMEWKGVLALTIASIVLAVASLKILAFIEVGGDVERMANMRLYGVLIVLPLLYFFVAKKQKASVSLAMDIGAIIACMGLFCGRLNCMVTGCCEGIPIFGHETMRWPIRELELVLYVVFFIRTGKRVLQNKTKGRAFPAFMVTYGVFRFVVEWVREEYTGSVGVLHLAHIWSLVSIIAGLIWLYLLQRDAQKALGKRTEKEKKAKK